MSGLKHRQCALARNRTSTFISVGHNYSECALAESRSYQHRFTIADTLDCSYSCWAWVRKGGGACREPFSHRLP